MFRVVFIGIFIFGITHSNPVKRVEKGRCYSFNERVVKKYKSLGCTVEEQLPSCYKTPVCPGTCNGENEAQHLVGDVWMEEMGSLKCACQSPDKYWGGEVPAIPTGGVKWPQARECQYIGCQSKQDPKIIIKPNTEAKIGPDEVCYCTEEKDVSGGVAYTLYCLPA